MKTFRFRHGNTKKKKKCLPGKEATNIQKRRKRPAAVTYISPLVLYRGRHTYALLGKNINPTYKKRGGGKYHLTKTITKEKNEK